MNKYTIIALIGKAGSGKDSVMQAIIAARPGQFNEIISCTTRPPREGEVDGRNYYFLTGEEFAQKVINFEMLEATSFNDWFYGTSIDSLSLTKPNIGVFNPDGIRALAAAANINLITIYIIASDKTRLIRQLNREENPDVEEIIRRWKTDNLDFSDIEFEVKSIINDEHRSVETVAHQILDHLDSIEH